MDTPGSRSAVIVDAVRTPLVRRNGPLSGWHPADLAAEVLRALVDRTGIDPALVDDVIMGCVAQVGAQSTNIGRNAVLGAGWPESVPATTIDRQCGSSQQAVHFAAQGVLAGAYDVVVAAGVELMSVVPMGSNAEANIGDPYGTYAHARYADREAYGVAGIAPQGISAEMITDKWGLTREELDRFALRSHERAARARAEGRFAAEILPVAAKVRDPQTGTVVEEGGTVDADNGIRETSMEALAALKPAFIPEGRVTAGSSSQISDGAAGVLIMREDVAERLGLRARARIVGFALAGDDPILMLTAPIRATEKLLERVDVGVSAIDRFEVNEAFAPVVLAWQREMGADLEKVNVNGGAIALGHPLGASGARLMTTLLNELERTQGRYGLQTMCEGGGLANATLIERIG